MAMTQEVDLAITDVINEAVLHETGKASVNLSLEKLDQSDAIKKKITDEFKLSYKNNGLISAPILSFNSGDQLLDLKIKTFLTQEMLRRGYIFSNVIYLSLKHNYKNIDRFFDNFHQILKKDSENFSHRFFKKNIKGPIAHSGFRRLT